MKKTSFIKSNSHIIKRLWIYLSKYKVYLVFAFILSLTSNLFALLGPYLSGKAIDEITKEGAPIDFNFIYLICGLMIGFYILSSLFSYLLSVLMIKMTQKVIVALRKDIFDNLAELPASYFDNVQVGDIISRITYDIDTLGSTLSTDLIQIATSIITVVGSFIFMLIISPVLITVFIVTIPASIISTIYITRKVKPLFKERSQKLGDLNGYAEEYISGHKTIKAYHKEEKIIANFEEKNVEASNAYYKADYYGTIVGPTMNLITNLSIAFVSIFGIILYLNNLITLGKISSFTLYSRKFSGPINEFANIMNELQSALAAGERIFRIIDEPKEKADEPQAHALNNVTGNVKMSNVDFSYVENVKILKNINFEAIHGKTIAIVGPTGGGKTTIINLLMRFYDPNSGYIYVDNQEIRDVYRKDLRLAFSMVLQDTWLFYGTIYENIAYGNQNATLDDVKRVAKMAKIDNYIEALPNNYNSILDEEGINISKGQKQLITIARAMLINAKMLILDEATSNVDTRTEIKIQEAMKQLMTGKTCFVIAHRLSTIVNSDLILVVKDGMIIEQGKHNELLRNNSFYAELYNSQFD